MTSNYDAIVVGGGHNALVCAAYLARAGRKTLVLEKRDVLGGAAVSEEIFPGFTYSVCSYVVSLLRPQIIRDLDLGRHGLDLIPLESTWTPQPDGPGLYRTADPEFTRRQVAQLSARDAEVLPEFARAMTRVGRLARPLLEKRPPDPMALAPRELLETLRFARTAAGNGAEDAALQARLFTMSAVDFLGRWFESPELIAAMSVSGIIGTFLGVRSPGTAYVLLHHYMGEIDGSYRSWGFQRGGTGGVSEAIASSARSHGAGIRTGTGVERILMRGSRAEGVVCENGDEIRAPIVVSGCDPRRTLLGFVGEEHLPDDLSQQLQRFRFRGSSAKVNLALDGLPNFRHPPAAGHEHLKGDITIAPSVDYLETAYDDAKYGEPSRRPFLDVVIPSLSDPTVAPPGKHVMSVFVQYAPYHLASGPETWPSRREELGDTVLDTLAEYAPDLKERVLHRQVLTPWDLEQEFGLTEGNIFHGELSLEQLAFLRPAAGWARYATPIGGLWMCGSGTHPGGGIMGAPGANAARAILGEKS